MSTRLNLKSTFNFLNSRLTISNANSNYLDNTAFLTYLEEHRKVDSQMYPHTVYVVIENDKQGNPRGFEKCAGKIFYSQQDAQVHYETHLNETEQKSHSIQEAVIMGREEYKELTKRTDIHTEMMNRIEDHSQSYGKRHS